MGASSGGVSVKLDSSKYELAKIVQDLFGNDFVESKQHFRY